MNLCKRGMSTREVILIKIKNKTKTLNEFLNIKNIEDNYYTRWTSNFIYKNMSYKYRIIFRRRIRK